MELRIRHMERNEALEVQKMRRDSFEGIESVVVPKPKTAWVAAIEDST